MTYPLVRNYGCPSRYYVTMEPVQIHPPRCGAAYVAVATLGPEAQQRLNSEDLAAWLLYRLGEPRSHDPIEALRTRIEREVEARGLAGCAMVCRPLANLSPELLCDLPLALVLLSKSSDIVWVAQKTPRLDRETLCRQLVTRDARFISGGQP